MRWLQLRLSISQSINKSINHFVLIPLGNNGPEQNWPFTTLQFQLFKNNIVLDHIHVTTKVT